MGGLGEGHWQTGLVQGGPIRPGGEELALDDTTCQGQKSTGLAEGLGEGQGHMGRGAEEHWHCAG